MSLEKNVENEKITIKKIAALAGVSVATVSRVMNEKGKYSSATEQRIREIMAEYNYVPNLLAKGLRTQRLPMIGIIMPDIRGGFFTETAREVELAMFSKGYASILCNTDRNKDLEKQCLEMMRSQQVSGLVQIYRTCFEEQYILQVPTVYIDSEERPKKNPKQCVYVESDNVSGGYLATRELIEKGCRRIGVLRSSSANPTHLSRMEGYQKALREAGIPYEESLVIDVDQVAIDPSYEQVKRKLPEMRLDGIFCMNNDFAVGSLKAIVELKKKIPKDVKLVGYDQNVVLQYANPPVTTIFQSVEEIGRIAVEQLCRMMAGEKPAQKHFHVPVELVKRKTT